MAEDKAITDICLDKSLKIRLSPDIERERAIAMDDLLHHNTFNCSKFPAPYHITLSLAEKCVRFLVKSANDNGKETHVDISLAPFRRLIKDYFLVCESYYKVARQASHAHIEAIDMGRRALHDEAAGLLKKRFLKHGIETDLPTARRLFTLICVLHIRVMY